MNRLLLGWVDTKFKKVCDDTEESNTMGILKSAGLGAIEGALNGLTILGGYTVIVLGVVAVLNKVKKDEA